MSSFAKRIAALEEEAVRLRPRGTLEVHRSRCGCTPVSTFVQLALSDAEQRFVCGGAACAEHAGCHIDTHPCAQPGRTVVVRGGSWLGLAPALTSKLAPEQR